MIQRAAAFHSAGDVTCSHDILSTKALKMSEMSYTAVYSVALDRLVFGNSQFGDKGMVAHQGPVRKKARMQGNPECSDLLDRELETQRYILSAFSTVITIYICHLLIPVYWLVLHDTLLLYSSIGLQPGSSTNLYILCATLEVCFGSLCCMNL